MRRPVNGKFTCDNTECDYSTANVFDFLEHCGVGFEWEIYLNSRYSFDFFNFLERLTELVDQGNLDEIYDHVQRATLVMVNASDGELDYFIEDSLVADEVEEGISEIENFLKENK